MAIKVLFNYNFAQILLEFWKYKNFRILFDVVEPVGHDGWVSVKDSNNKSVLATDSIKERFKWRIIETSTQKAITKQQYDYDYIWTFDDSGLCMVRLNDKYGFINEQGNEIIPVEYDDIYNFENGVTVAKKNGEYLIIDTGGKTKVSIDSQYVEVRGFYNGEADARDRSGKWSKIDTNGQVVNSK